MGIAHANDNIITRGGKRRDKRRRDVSARDRVVDVQSDACVVHRASSIARRRATTTLGSRARVRLDRARGGAWRSVGWSIRAVFICSSSSEEEEEDASRRE